MSIVDVFRDRPLADKDVRLEDFTIYGYKALFEGRAAELHDLVTDATIVRTIDGAPTLTIEANDSDRFIEGTGLLSYRVTAVTGKHAFELVGAKKSGDAFTMTFEDVSVAEMRRMDTPRKVAVKTMSRVEFAYLLLSEIPTIDFVTAGIPLSVTHTELARGKDTQSASTKKENTWTALNRIFGEVRWRFWVDNRRAFAAPDPYLLKLPEAAHLTEHTDGVDDIDFDLDSGKPIQTLTFRVVSDRWNLAIGSRLVVDTGGPDGGNWLVSEFRRSLFSPVATVKAIKGVFPLPEPVAPETAPAPIQLPFGGTLGGGTVAPSAPAGTFKAYAAKQMQALYGWGPDQFDAVDQIWTPESGWDPNAQNPTSTAFGIAQFLDPTWASTGIAKTSDGYRQIDAGLIYIAQRYGTPIQALQFRHAHGWY